MLKLKPNCECCGVDLPPASDTAVVCSFECTFCKDCATVNFKNTCPNCGGELVKRPVRTPEYLEKHPASTTRFLNEKHANYANYGSRGTTRID